MDNKTIESTDHNYDPVNKYIDEKARLRRTKSVWGYTRSLALFLIAFGVFLILAAYAYHIFKKPHKLIYSQIETIKSENEIKDINNDIVSKNNEIKELENDLKSSPENEKLNKELEALKKEKAELEKKLEKGVYSESVSVFKSKDIDDNLTVTTGFGWDKLDNLRSGKKHSSDWCYLESKITTAKYYFDNETDQSALLRELGVTKSDAISYKKHCKN